MQTYCSACHRSLENDDRFCPYCGAPQAGLPPEGRTPSHGIPPVDEHPPAQDNKQFMVWTGAAIAVAIVLGASGFLISRGGGADPIPIPSDTTPTSTIQTTDPDPDDTTLAPEVTGSLLSYVTASAPAQSRNGVDKSGFMTTYDPANLLDGDADTSWRMDGDGSGTTLTFDFGTARTVDHLGLINGLAKVDPVGNEDRYPQNRRVLAVTWTIGDTVEQQTLADDHRSMQDISFDPVSASSIQLRIDQVSRPGTGNVDHTAISDVLIAND